MASSFVGMPIFLEDATGDIAACDFVDYYGRMSFNVRRTARTPGATAYAVTDTLAAAGRGGVAAPVAYLVYGPQDALGTVQRGQLDPVPMEQYLAKVGRSSSTRKFKASNGEEYTWTLQTDGDCEWTCMDRNGYQVAAYDAESKLTRNAGNPGRGKQLYIDEQHQHLAGELVTTLIMMRHIRQHGL